MRELMCGDQIGPSTVVTARVRAGNMESDNMLIESIGGEEIFPTWNDSPKGAFDANEMCTLEKAIRSSMRENRERKKKERAEREAKFAERRR
mmetsp:Transcript_11716/g.11594  ORF Transcript_11716/g.11594 Transcript_11716/m.11594 type:complete len:92 (-) Transcript_11716:11-286(-)